MEKVAAVKIQRRAKIYVCHQKNVRRHRAVIKIQGFVKMKWLSFLFQILRTNVKKIQVNFTICHIFSFKILGCNEKIPSETEKNE